MQRRLAAQKSIARNCQASARCLPIGPIAGKDFAATLRAVIGT
jgi:hypothetical protein